MSGGPDGAAEVGAAGRIPASVQCAVYATGIFANSTNNVVSVVLIAGVAWHVRRAPGLAA